MNRLFTVSLLVLLIGSPASMQPKNHSTTYVQDIMALTVKTLGLIGGGYLTYSGFQTLKHSFYPYKYVIYQIPKRYIQYPITFKHVIAQLLGHKKEYKKSVKYLSQGKADYLLSGMLHQADHNVLGILGWRLSEFKDCYQVEVLQVNKHYAWLWSGVGFLTLDLGIALMLRD